MKSNPVPLQLCSTEQETWSVGIDLIHLKRLARAIKRQPHFFNRLTHSEEHPEWTDFDSLGLLWAGYLWTGKEAVAKALKTGVWREGIDWPDLRVGHWSRFEELKHSFSHWHALLYPTHVPSSQIEVSNLKPAPRSDSSDSISLPMDHLSPDWITGQVTLYGPALSLFPHTHFQHIFTLIAPHSSSLRSPPFSNLSPSSSSSSLPISDFSLEEYQAFSIVYAWNPLSS